MARPDAKPPDSDGVAQGLRHLMWDAAFATAVGALNSGVVLVAYALYFGVST